MIQSTTYIFHFERPQRIRTHDDDDSYIGFVGCCSPRRRLGASNGYGVFVKAGIYEETVNITRKNVVLWGEGIGKTVITGSRFAVKPNNTDMPWTATLTVIADGFVAQDLTIRNTAGPIGTPAVALRSDSNKSLLYLGCDIAGTIDFVYGNAKAVFEGCRILVRRPRYKPGNDESGFVFRRCNITAADGVDTYLGRPWKNYSHVVFMESNIINPAGWIGWKKEDPLPGETAKTVEYLESGNVGVGARTRDRVPLEGLPGDHQGGG
uniref:Pectinesterase catalytic domain-containing protein n=1 Tax=Leersia perrieri TaxID=77586 RepID=A0A0D9V8Z3_9ORYZ